MSQERRRRMVAAILTPPTVSLIPPGDSRAMKNNAPTKVFSAEEDGPFKTCCLCHCQVLKEEGKGDPYPCDYDSALLRETLRKEMVRLRLELDEKAGLCPFCLSQLSGLVKLRREIDRLEQRMASMTIGLKALLLSTPSDEEEVKTMTSNDGGDADAGVCQDGDDFYTENEQVLQPPFSCVTCGRSFKKLSNLHKHSCPISSHHKNKDEDESKSVKTKDKTSINHPTATTTTGGGRVDDDDDSNNIYILGLIKEESQEEDADMPNPDHGLEDPFAMPPDDHVHDRQEIPSTSQVPTEKSVVRCPHCPKSFRYSYKLKVHSVVHSGQRPHGCKLCTQSFKYVWDLNQHVQKVHLGKRFTCSICRRTFGERYRLKRHTTIFHSVSRTRDVTYYPCSICRNRNFTNKSNWLRHNRSHHSKEELKLKEQGVCLEKQEWSCSLCDKVIPKGRMLSRHMAVHSEERPFLCPSCPMAFARKEYLSRHVRRIHDGVSKAPRKKQKTSCLPCGLCSRIFGHNFTLQRHIRTVHGGEKRVENRRRKRRPGPSIGVKEEERGSHSTSEAASSAGNPFILGPE